MQTAKSEIINKSREAKNSLIVALDVPTAKEASEIFTELKDVIGTFKVGMQLFTAEGAPFVRKLVKQGAKIFLDLKFHDIPNTVASAGIEAARLGVWMFNIHASGGREMMERTADAVRETAVREGLAQPEMIAVTVLTSSNVETMSEVGIKDDPAAQVVKLAKLAANCGLDGVVASPLESRVIREEIEKSDFLIVTPGVRPQLEISNDDQKRVLTPAAAIRAGADYLVIGRPILRADDRIQATRNILQELENIAENK